MSNVSSSTKPPENEETVTSKKYIDNCWGVCVQQEALLHLWARQLTKQKGCNMLASQKNQLAKHDGCNMLASQQKTLSCHGL